MKKTPFGSSAASAMNSSSSSFSAFKFPNPFGSLGRRHKSSKDLAMLSTDEVTMKGNKKKQKKVSVCSSDRLLSIEASKIDDWRK
uniref:Ovule protein n=1 Tax=Steinernema glaseri TaxID=37863 RepID=A0A1I7YLT4_9BILA